MKDIIKNLRNSTFVTLFYIFLAQFGFQKTWYEYLIVFCIIVVVLQLLKLLIPLWKFLGDLKRRKLVKVAILNGSIYSPVRENKCVRSWIGVTPEMWRYALLTLFPYFSKSWNRAYYEIPVTSIDDSWTIIINPFGDNFPEKDLKLHETFYKICDYVANGGIFVVTGGAFWAHQNPVVSSKEEWAITHLINGAQGLEKSLFFQEFGVKCTGDIFSNGQVISKEPKLVDVEQIKEDIGIFGDILQGISSLNRFRATSKDTANYLPIIRQKNESNYPIVLIRYGKGVLIHCGLYIQSEASDEFKVVIRLLTRIIKRKIEFF